MQLTIDCEDIVGIKMSATEESQDEQVSALINDIKKDIQSDIKDDLKVKDEKVSKVTDVVMELAEGEADISDIKPEIQINGSGEDEIVPNGDETPNSDKENDVPKDSETVVKLENNIENTASSTNCIVEITRNQLITDNMDTENDNASAQDETAKEDLVNSTIDNMLTINDSEEALGKQELDKEKIASQIANAVNTETPNVNPPENNEQVDAELMSDLTNSMEVSAAKNTQQKPLTSSENDISIVTEDIKSVESKDNSENKKVISSQMEIDDSEIVENNSNDEVDKSAIVESTSQLVLPAETIEKQNETTKSDPEDLPIDEQSKLLKKENKEKRDSDLLKMTEIKKETSTDDDKNHTENANQSEDITDLVVDNVFFKTSEDKMSSSNDSEKLISCKNNIESVTEKEAILSKEIKTERENIEDIDNVLDSTISDATSTIMETNGDKQTENQIIVDASQNEPKTEPIDKLDSIFSDDKTNEINIKTEVQQNDESEFVVEDSVETLKDTDCVIDSTLNDTTSTVIETNREKQTENEKIIEVSQSKIIKSEPIDKLDSNFSDGKTKEISLKTEVQQNDKSEFAVENSVLETPKDTDCVKDSTISDATSTVIETNSDKQTEKKMIVDVSQNKIIKSEPIDKLDSSFSDGKTNEISLKTEVHKKDESESVFENLVIEKLKDTDCVSVSSMEVDDVEIVPTEKVNTEMNKSQDDTMDVSITNEEDNIIEIFDQDVVESTDNVELGKNKDQQKNTNDEKVDISDDDICDDIKIVENAETKQQTPKKEESNVESKPLPVVCKLSNTLDILSDEEDEPPSKVSKVEETKPELEDKQCIDIDDDDDIMLIEDAKEITEEAVQVQKEVQKTSDKVNDETGEKEEGKSDEDVTPKINKEEPITTDIESPKLSEKEASPPIESVKDTSKPLLPINFLKSAKKNLADMTRDELEEFCILKIVEGIVDRSSLSDIKSKIKNIEKNMEEYKKKAMLLSKQNRDLQVVLKSVQEEQKNRPNSSITPLKITRSVGMQVLMLDKGPKKKSASQNTNNTAKPVRNTVQPAKSQKTPINSQTIPVPRLIPASPAKSTPSSPIATIVKPHTPNGIRTTTSPALKAAEKRRQSTTSNMTVDLTDDEPPAKVNKSSPVPPVRVVPSQNLMPFRGQMQTNNQRKVFIPINGQGHTLVRGQTAVMLKSLPQSMGQRQRLPSMPRMASNQLRINLNRHPAPLPDVMKQYQPPTWKALPPAPDLKLSKVENGIVISWKIEGYQEDSYERIASYQLYAYQETSVPPSTALWKKIGDVKALPLPMACTLTQFMAGFKYYFAVRAVDVKSRLGPFSLPGSILLLNKM